MGFYATASDFLILLHQNLSNFSLEKKDPLPQALPSISQKRLARASSTTPCPRSPSPPPPPSFVFPSSASQRWLVALWIIVLEWITYLVWMRMGKWVMQWKWRLSNFQENYGSNKNVLLYHTVYICYFNELSQVLENIFHVNGKKPIWSAGSNITLFLFLTNNRRQLLTPIVFQKHPYVPYIYYPLIMCHFSEGDMTCSILQGEKIKNIGE